MCLKENMGQGFTVEDCKLFGMLQFLIFVLAVEASNLKKLKELFLALA
jgi:hypothetical protein